MAETYRTSRRQSRRITAAAYKLLEDDLNEMDLSRPQLTSQLVANLQSAIQKSLVLGKPSAVAASCYGTGYARRCDGRGGPNATYSSRGSNGRTTYYKSGNPYRRETYKTYYR